MHMLLINSSSMGKNKSDWCVVAVVGITPGPGGRILSYMRESQPHKLNKVPGADMPIKSNCCYCLLNML